MGKFTSSVAFEYPAPRPEEIARVATEVCGLKVTWREDLEPNGLHREFSGFAVFDALPDANVEVYAYERSVAHTPGQEEGVQHVYVDGYVADEGSLPDALIAGLSRLGGTYSGPVPLFHKPLTVDEVQWRRRENEEQIRRLQPLMAVGCLFSALLMPLYLVWALVQIPWMIVSGAR